MALTNCAFSLETWVKAEWGGLERNFKVRMWRKSVETSLFSWVAKRQQVSTAEAEGNEDSWENIFIFMGIVACVLTVLI